jgi:hypothetical protein
MCVLLADSIFTFNYSRGASLYCDVHIMHCISELRFTRAAHDNGLSRDSQQSTLGAMQWMNPRPPPQSAGKMRDSTYTYTYSRLVGSRQGDLHLIYASCGRALVLQHSSWCGADRWLLARREIYFSVLRACTF